MFRQCLFYVMALHVQCNGADKASPKFNCRRFIKLLGTFRRGQSRRVNRFASLRFHFS